MYCFSDKSYDVLFVTVLDIIISFFHHFIVIVLEANKQFLCHRNFVWILNVIVGPVTIAIECSRFVCECIYIWFVKTSELYKQELFNNKDFQRKSYNHGGCTKNANAPFQLKTNTTEIIIFTIKTGDFTVLILK